MAKKFPFKLRLGERFGKGLGSIFDHLSPSMQLPLLKVMKQLHPVFADRFIYDLANKYSTPGSGYSKNESERALRSWVYDNVNVVSGRDNEIMFPLKLEHIIQKQLNEQREKGLPTDFSEHMVDYLGSTERKIDDAIRKQTGETELTAEELQAANKFKERQDIISGKLEKHKPKYPMVDPDEPNWILLEPKGPGGTRMGRTQFEVLHWDNPKKPTEKRYKVWDLWDDEKNTWREDPKFVKIVDEKHRTIMKSVPEKYRGGLISLIS
jgi:hypothetical protein